MYNLTKAELKDFIKEEIIRIELINLNEGPYVFKQEILDKKTTDVNLKDPIKITLQISSIDHNLAKVIKKAISYNRIVKVNKNIYKITNRNFGGICFALKDDRIVGATNMKAINYFNKSYLQPIYTEKFERLYPDLMLELYLAISNRTGVPIITDSEQTEQATSVWKKWLNDPKKYGLEIETVSLNGKNIENPFGDSKEHFKYLVSMKSINAKF